MIGSGLALFVHGRFEPCYLAAQLLAARTDRHLKALVGKNQTPVSAVSWALTDVGTNASTIAAMIALFIAFHMVIFSYLCARIYAPQPIAALLCGRSEIRPTSAGMAPQPSLPGRKRASASSRPTMPDGRCKGLLSERYPPDGMQFGMIAQHLAQPVKRNAAAQVMNVMHPDIRREPPQHGRQIVVRASRQRRLMQLPVPVARPGDVFELVLHGQQPDPHRCGKQHNRQMHREKRRYANQSDHRAHQQRDPGIRQQRQPSMAASPHAFVRLERDAAGRTNRQAQRRT